ncbi:MAG: redoxin domain-containing protein [Epsilonproteobacteria bacterium]|nr:redoxin domain-containing protein [Campylobacterota bacterium]
MKIFSMLFIISLLFSTVSAKDSNTTTPSFVLKTVNRGDIHIKEVPKGISIQELKDNKMVVLAFIAYNGQPCLHLIEILNEMKKRHKDFGAFAVEMRGLKGEKLKEFAKNKSIEFPIIGYENSENFVNYIAKNAGWNGTMPFILVLNKKGEVKYMQIGLIPIEGFEKAYEELKK